MKNVLFSIFILIYLPALSEINRDSLFNVWSNEKLTDSARLKAIHNLAWNGYLFSKPDSAFYFAQLQFQLADKTGKKDHKAIALNTMGASYHVRGDYKKALEYYQLTFEADSLNDDPRGMAGSLNNMGIIHSALGNPEKALSYYERSVALLKEAEDIKTLGATLHNMGMLSHNKGDFDKALEFYAQSIEAKKQVNDKKGVASTFNNIGNTYSTRGDYINALRYFRNALSLYNEMNDLQGKATTLNNIGNIFRYQKDYKKATDYYHRSLELREQAGDQRGISSALHSLGTAFLEQKDFPQARSYFEQSLKIDEASEDPRNIAYSLHNLGSVYAEEGDHAEAIKLFLRSLDIQEEIDDKKGIVNSLSSIGKSLFELGQYDQAVDRCNSSLAMAREMDALSYQKDACECLYLAYKGMGNAVQALAFHEQKIALGESLQEGETIRQLERMEFANKAMADSLIREEEKLRVALSHQREVSRQTQNRNIAIASGLLMLLLAGGAFNRLQYVRRSKAELQKEKDRSEELLLNILPEETAEELKAKGSADARLIESVTVLFTDFKGFTQMSEILTPKELVKDLHNCFSAFDRILDKYGIEKIKTIGDAYMAAGGLPTPTDDHAAKVIQAALEMRDVVEEGKARKIAAGQPFFEIRIGVHTGPVVAGIVGVKKFQYDIWGDTVNMASRMESSGEVGKVNISEATFTLVKNHQDFQFDYRGKVKAKGKGEVEMYFADRTSRTI